MELWSSDRLMIEVNGPEGVQEIRLPGPFARLGSHPQSDVLLPRAAKRTLYVHATEHGIFCVDLRDHSKPNSEQSGQWLLDGAPLVLDDYTLKVSIEAAAESHESLVAPASLLARCGSTRPALSLRVTCKGGPKAKYRVHRALTIVGRDTSCGLNLAGTKVSSPHCILYAQQGRTWCIDLLSNNGTLLNGQRLDVMEVMPGDRLGVGEFRLLHNGYVAAKAVSPQQVRVRDPLAASGVAGARDLPNGEWLVLDAADPSTVQIGRGDTIDLTCKKAAEPKGNEGDFTRMTPVEPDIPPPSPQSAAQESAVSHSQPVPEDEYLPDSQAPAPDSQIDQLRERLAQHEVLVAKLSAQLENEQARWRSERDCLRFELTTQANVIGDLKRELAGAKAAANRQLAAVDFWPRTAPAAANVLAPAKVEAATVVSQETKPIAGALLEVEHSKADINDEVFGSADLNLRLDKRPAVDKHLLAPPNDLVSWIPLEGVGTSEEQDSTRAERETIQSMGSVHGTIVWRHGQSRQPLTLEDEHEEEPLPPEPGLSGHVNRAVPSGETSDVAPDSLIRGNPRNELSMFVNNRLQDLNQNQYFLARLVGAGAVLALIAVLTCTGWWLLAR